MAGKAPSPSSGKWPKRALGAAQKRDRSTLIFSSLEHCLQVARLMSLTIFSPGLFVVFLIVHSSVVTMSNKHSLSK
mgnify:CR=1 FL=1